MAVIGDEVAIAWVDGTESYFTQEALRKACPCATCQGEPDAMGKVVRPPVHYQENSFILLEMTEVGGYAIQLRWADGHGTGIYSFEYLKQLSEEGA